MPEALTRLNRWRGADRYLRLRAAAGRLHWRAVHAAVFGSVALEPWDGAVVLAVGAAFFTILELEKCVRRVIAPGLRRGGRGLAQDPL